MYRTLFFAVAVLCMALVGSAVAVPSPAEQYVQHGGGGIAWGNRACSAMREFDATDAQTRRWLVRQYRLTPEQARNVVRLAHSRLNCP